MTDTLIRQYVAWFNQRRLRDAAALFATDAVFEHPSLTPTPRGPEGFLRFAETWIRAFPDGQFTIEHVEQRGDTICEVDLIGTGTHTGDLDLGPYLVFKAIGARTTFRFRQLLEVRAGQITCSSLSFDTQDLIRQLARVDDAQLMACLERIRQLTDDLAGVHGDAERRQGVLDRLGRELDAARNVVRPYFRR